MGLWLFSVVFLLSITGVVGQAAHADDPQPSKSAARSDTSDSLADKINAIAKEAGENNANFQRTLNAIAKQREKLTAEDIFHGSAEANRKHDETRNMLVKSLIALIKTNPTAPEVMEGLILLDGTLSHSPSVDPELEKIVLEHQLMNPKIGRLCYQFRNVNNDQTAENILTAVAEKHPTHEVRGQATFALGSYYVQTARTDLPRPAPIEGFSDLIPKVQPELWLPKAEAAFQQVLKHYADVKSPDGGTRLSEEAAKSLLRVRNIAELKPGKPAPLIAGETVDGQPIALRDYQGKVVVLVFWGSWCRPCMAMVPHERALVERMQNKPFALLGVNCEDPRDKARATMRANKMNWPSFWDGGGLSGPIESAFNVLHWPTVYVVDKKGTLRYIDVEEKELDAIVDKLVAELE